MKKLFKVTVLVALFFGTVVSAADDSRVRLVSGEDKSLIFTVHTQFQNTDIKMLSENKELIFSEKITGESVYSKRFNLKNLKNGNYVFVIDNALKQVVYNIKITENVAEIVAENETSKAVFKDKDGIVYMNLLNIDKENVNVKVYDSSDRVLFEETITGEVLVEKSFNFIDALSDSYTVAVQDGTNTYYKTVLVK